MVDLVIVKSADIVSDHADVSSGIDVSGPTAPGDYTVLAVVGRATRTVQGVNDDITQTAAPLLSGSPWVGGNLTWTQGVYTGATTVGGRLIKISYDEDLKVDVETTVTVTGSSYTCVSGDAGARFVWEDQPENATNSLTVRSNILTLSAPAQMGAMTNAEAVSTTEVRARVPATAPSSVAPITGYRARRTPRGEHAAGNFANSVTITSGITLGDWLNFTGATSGVEYALEMAAVSANGVGGWGPAVYVTASVSPVLASGTLVPGSATVVAPWSINQAGGTLYWAINNLPNMTAANIKAATGLAGNVAATVTGAQPNLTPAGLSATTSYVLHLVYEHPTTGFSNVISVGFSTVAAATAVHTAEWGDLDPAGSGGYQPKTTAGAKIALTGYSSLVSGNLNGYVPTIFNGHLIFDKTGAPDGATLRCTYAGGTVDILIDVSTNTRTARTMAEANTAANAFKGTTNGTFTLALREGTYALTASDLSGITMGATAITGIDVPRLEKAVPVFVGGNITIRSASGERAVLDGTWNTNGARGVLLTGVTLMTANTVRAIHYEPESPMAVVSITKGATTTIQFIKGNYNFNQIVVGDDLMVENMTGDWAAMNGLPLKVTALNSSENAVTLDWNSSTYAAWSPNGRINGRAVQSASYSATTGRTTFIVEQLTAGYVAPAVGSALTLANFEGVWAPLNGQALTVAATGTGGRIEVAVNTAAYGPLAPAETNGTPGRVKVLRGYYVASGNAVNVDLTGKKNLVILDAVKIDNLAKNPAVGYAPNGFTSDGGVDRLVVVNCEGRGFFNVTLMGWGHEFWFHRNMFTDVYADIFPVRTTRVVTDNLDYFPKRSVTAITAATPPVVTTSAAHGLTTGDTVVFDAVGNTYLEKDSANTNALRKAFFVTVLSATTFSLQEADPNINSAKRNVNGTGFAAYAGGGSVYCGVHVRVDLRRNYGSQADEPSLKAKHSDYIQSSSSLNRLNVKWKILDNYCNWATAFPIATQGILGKGGASDPTLTEGEIRGNIIVSGAVHNVLTGLSRADQSPLDYNIGIRQPSEYPDSAANWNLIGASQRMRGNIYGSRENDSAVPNPDTSNLAITQKSTSPSYDDVFTGSFVADAGGVFRCAALLGITGTYDQRVAQFLAIMRPTSAYAATYGPWADPEGPLHPDNAANANYAPKFIAGNGAYFQLPVSAVADGNLFTLAATIKTGATITGTHYLYGGGRCFVRITNGKIHVQVRTGDTTPVTLGDVITTANIPANATFGLFVKVNTGASPSIEIAVNTVAQLVTNTVAPITGTMDIAQGGELEFLAASTGATPFGLLGWSGLFFDTTTPDLTAADFWDAAGAKPKTPVGKGAPKVLITDNAADITASVNEAPSGAVMTLVGALLDAA